MKVLTIHRTLWCLDVFLGTSFTFFYHYFRGNILSYPDFLTNLFNTLTPPQESARKNLIKSKEKSKKHYDKCINVKNFKADDKAYLLKKTYKK